MNASRFAALAGVGIVCTLSTAARAAPVTVVFTTVDSFEADWFPPPIPSESGSLTGRVVGVVEGQAAPAKYGLYFFNSNNGGSTAAEHMNRCERMAAMAMHRPGRYNFVVAGEVKTGFDGVTYFRLPTCKLVRR